MISINIKISKMVEDCPMEPALRCYAIYYSNDKSPCPARRGLWWYQSIAEPCMVRMRTLNIVAKSRTAHTPEWGIYIIYIAAGTWGWSYFFIHYTMDRGTWFKEKLAFIVSRLLQPSCCFLKHPGGPVGMVLYGLLLSLILFEKPARAWGTLPYNCPVITDQDSGRPFLVLWTAWPE